MGNCFVLDLAVPISSTEDPTADPEDIGHSYDDKPTAEELELKELLSNEDSPSYQQFSNHASRNRNAGVLKCWSRIAAYRAAGKDVYQEVCQISEECYISACSHESMLKFGEVKISLQALQQKIDARARAGKPSRPTKKLRPIFDELEALCFHSIYEEVYPLYKAHCAEQIAAAESGGALPVTENLGMHPDEFEHIAASPDSAHPAALITCCQKRSNKKYYAMKAIPKSYLLWKHRRNLGNILQELRSYTGLDHPFISSLSVAFQTSVTVFLVQPLSFYLDLRQFALARFDRGRLPLKLVQFYSAEIVSALNYLHSNDYVFKELRPSNILVDGDGHVMLRNCSSIEDVKVSSQKKSEIGASGAAAPGEEEQSLSFGRAKGAHDDWSEEASFDGMHVSSAKQQVSHPQSSSTTRKPGVGFGGTKVAAGWNSGNIDEPCDLNITPPVGNGSGDVLDQCKNPGKSQNEFRRTSDIVRAAAHSFGHGVASPLSAESITFLAPELILQCFQTQSCHNPASAAVDWWALGCTIYTMLVGRAPFREIPLEELEYRLPNELVKNKYEVVFANLFGVVNFSVVLTVDEEGNEEKLDPVAVLLLRNLLQFSPAERLSKNSPEASEGQDSAESNKSSGNNSNNSSNPRHSSGSLDDSGNVSIRSASSIRYQKIAEHAFFTSIDWQILEEKRIPPPLPFELDVAPTAVASVSCSGTGLSPGGSGTFTPAEASSSPLKGSAFVHAHSLRFDSFSSVLEMHGKRKWAEEEASCARKLATCGGGKSVGNSVMKAVRTGGIRVLPSIKGGNDAHDVDDGCKSVASTRGVRIGALSSGQLSDGSGEGEGSVEKKHQSSNSGGSSSAQSASLSPQGSQTTTHSKFFVSPEQQTLFQGWDFVNYRELRKGQGDVAAYP